MNDSPLSQQVISEAELHDLSLRFGRNLTQEEAHRVLRLLAQGYENPCPSLLPGREIPEYLK